MADKHTLKRIGEIREVVIAFGRPCVKYWEAMQALLDLANTIEEEELGTIFDLAFETLFRLQDGWCEPLLPPEIREELVRQIRARWAASSADPFLRSSLRALAVDLAIDLPGLN